MSEKERKVLPQKTLAEIKAYALEMNVGDRMTYIVPGLTDPSLLGVLMLSINKIRNDDSTYVTLNLAEGEAGSEVRVSCVLKS